MRKKNFIDSIKIIPDIEKEKLIKIQKEIQKDMTKENIIQLTRNLTESEKERLKQLYIEQINMLNEKTNNCKERILKIRNKAIA